MSDTPADSTSTGGGDRPTANSEGAVDDAANKETASGSDEDPDHGRVVSEPSGDQPSIEELRAELNEQFESIKILNPGQYELNLMELYNREEYIISLQEDGRYVIDVPDSWRDAED
ncbi:Zn-ribbon containing protein [Natrialba sp. INN-245]|uniref:Zn-ribbon domain-containing protein n=1 Tax=Natrialba sp. INN-245 TaxID=2690967 RepID=UPI0031B6EEEE